MRKFLGQLDELLFGWYDSLVFDRVAHLPGRVVVLIAVLFYPGVALVVPLALGWSVPYLIDANLIGAAVAATTCIGWYVVQIQAKDRRHLVEWTTDLRLLDAAEFEFLVGELFRREGWKVEETGRQDAPDGNIDLKLSRGRQRRIVQCKRWTAKWVGVEDVRAFGGTLLREGLLGTDGVFVTLSEFTQQAMDEARESGLTLVDHRDLFARVEKIRRIEPCPECQDPMVLGRSDYGWWFRCVRPGCNGKRDLGKDPGRAVELLTQQH
jgi:hypothetical protein